MTTTAVFAEILIIGLQVEGWLLLALLTALDTQRIDLTGAQDFAALSTVVVLAVAYVLGIVIDRLADTLLDWFEKRPSGRRLKARVSKNERLAKPAKVATMRMVVMHESETMSRFLDYQRTRWRIARATVLNLLIAAPLAALYLIVRTDHDLLWTLALLVAAMVLVVATYTAGVRIQDAWIARLVDAYGIVRGRPDATDGHARDSRDIVAAVCYRRRGDDIDLLLVRTTGGRRWTFPKGHVEHGERAWEAAAREAREEAGVAGDVTTQAFTRYRYPATRADGKEAVVSAYLLSVEREGAPASGEGHRTPTWVSPDEAVRRLAVRRNRRHAEEHARVVREAVAALSPGEGTTGALHP